MMASRASERVDTVEEGRAVAQTVGQERGAEPGGTPGSARPADLLLPLAEAKLAVPRERAELVQRPRLLHTLDGTEGVALTLVSALPG